MVSVAIIGGYGSMGRLFARILKKRGLDVVIAGPRPEKGIPTAKELGVAFDTDNKKVTKNSDIVIITVPIMKTEDVIREVAPVVKPGSLLMDLTSVKEGPCALMDKLAPKGAEVLGCHPVFGPAITEFSGQNIVLCPVRGEKWFNFMKKLFEAEGARTTVCSPKEHDKAMGVVQGMTHFMLISAGMAMRNMSFDLDDSKKFSSPVYSLIMDLIGRILGQDPKLYAEIQMNNKETARVRDVFMRSAKELDRIIEDGDEEAFVLAMTKAAAHFGDTSGAMERTSRLLKKKE
jgi:prephenate dehydrogenase